MPFMTDRVYAFDRHMFGLGYSTTRAASGRDYFAGDQNGKPTLVFADDCRAAFTSEVSQRMVSFAPPGIPVDHFGNLEGEDNGSVGGRGTYWNPSGPLTVPKGRDVPEWVRSVAEGKRLRGATAAL
jgi:hypothetical protein